MAALRLVICQALWLRAAAESQAFEALAVDDACSGGESSCAFNALQHRQQRGEGSVGPASVSDAAFPDLGKLFASAHKDAEETAQKAGAWAQNAKDKAEGAVENALHTAEGQGSTSSSTTLPPDVQAVLAAAKAQAAQASQGTQEATAAVFDGAEDKVQGALQKIPNDTAAAIHKAAAEAKTVIHNADVLAVSAVEGIDQQVRQFLSTYNISLDLPNLSLAEKTIFQLETEVTQEVLEAEAAAINQTQAASLQLKQNVLAALHELNKTAQTDIDKAKVGFWSAANEVAQRFSDNLAKLPPPLRQAVAEVVDDSPLGQVINATPMPEETTTPAPPPSTTPTTTTESLITPPGAQDVRSPQVYKSNAHSTSLAAGAIVAILCSLSRK